jgi:hypothetical protein
MRRLEAPETAAPPLHFLRRVINVIANPAHPAKGAFLSHQAGLGGTPIPQTPHAALSKQAYEPQARTRCLGFNLPVESTAS